VDIIIGHELRHGSPDKSLSQKQIDAGLKIVNNHSDRVIDTILPEEGSVGVNRVFYAEKFVINCLNLDSNRTTLQGFERSIAANPILRETLELASGGRISTPEMVGFDTDLGVIVTRLVLDNLPSSCIDIKTKEITNSFKILSQLVPTQQLVDKFPFRSRYELSGDKYLTMFRERIQLFHAFLAKIKEEDVGANSIDIEFGRQMIDEMEEFGIVPKLEEEMIKLSGLRFDTPNDVFLHPTDAALSNYLVGAGPSGIVTNLVDLESVEFASGLNTVASVVHHPKNIDTLMQVNGLREHVLGTYVNSLNLSSRDMPNISTISKINRFKWITTVMKNMVLGRENSQAVNPQVFGRLHFLYLEDWPRLKKMIDLPFVQVDSAHRYTPNPNKRVEGLIYPLTGLPPKGGYQKFVSEIHQLTHVSDKKMDESLREVNSSYEFSRKEIFANYPYVITGLKSIKEVGNGILFGRFGFQSSRALSGGERIMGYVTRTKEVDENRGGLIFIADKIDNLESFKTNIDPPPVAITQEMLDRLDASTKYNGRVASLTEKMAKMINNDSKVSVIDFELDETNGEYLSVVTLKTSDGKSYPVKVNRAGISRFEQASIFDIRDQNGNPIFVKNTRLLPPIEDDISEKILLEKPRGFSSGEHPLTELAREIKVPISAMKISGTRIIAQSYEYDAVNDFIFFVDMKNAPNQTFDHLREGNLDTDDFGEELSTVTLSPREGFENLTDNKDAFSVYVGAMRLISEKKLVFDNTSYSDDTAVLLEKQFVIQEGGYKLVIPRGKKDYGTSLGSLYPNTGSDRIVDEVRTSSSSDFLKESKGRSLVPIKIKDIIQMIEDGVFDIPTGSALVVSLIKGGFLKYNP